MTFSVTGISGTNITYDQAGNKKSSVVIQAPPPPPPTQILAHVEDLIGTNALGTAALGNGGTGLAISSNDNQVGGTAVGAPNTISGNARRDFGKDFVISAPEVLAGSGKDVQPPAGCRPFVIPINWRSHSAKLVVCLK